MTTQAGTRWSVRALATLAGLATCLTALVFAGWAQAASSLAAGHGRTPIAQSASVADRTLAAQEHRLQLCLRQHPGHCAGSRRAVQLAREGLAAARAARRPHTHARHHTHHGASGSSKGGSIGSSPSGSTGSTESLAGASAPTGSGNETTGTGTQTTGSGTQSSGSGPEQTGSGSGSTGSTPPLHESAPEEVPLSREALEKSDPAFEPGVNAGWDPNADVPAAAKLGARLVRLDVNIESTPQELESIVGDYAEKGISVLPMADFYGRLPTPAEASNLANWARVFGPGGSFWVGRPDGAMAMRSIEFGNETSYNYQYSQAQDTEAGYASRAQTYALRFKEAVQAIRAVNPGVGLLAQADSGNAGPLWVENMFKAVPNLGELVAGWTIHPYGPTWRERIEEVIQETAAQGAPSTIPIDLTEWGISTDNGVCLTENYGWNPCTTYQQAAEDLKRSVAEMHQMLGSRFGLFMLYQDHDQRPTGTTNDREAYFGALQHELQPKGAYTTAVQELFAS
ncbi:MAG TPA: hypothetical protein VMS02_09390 [Solirubrobacteraceae bacterium]|nr:hypothetical protein [Solirubrobacteraceae bacterium]